MAGYKLFLIFAAAALVNILPLLLLDIGGDIDFHLALIKCFAGQFRQGDFYPRWCFNANAGLGSPLPLFYFPLPYYAAMLFYPLISLGVSLHAVYVLSLFAAAMLTGLTCYLWLEDIVSPPPALLSSLLFIFLPYRMEAVLFRSAYAEVWAIALLPLVFKYARKLARGENAVLPLAAVFGLLFITHLPSAAVAVLGGGIYMLCGVKGRAVLLYAAGALWGMALAAFYLLPAVYYQRFMAKMPLFILGRRVHGWPNTFLNMDNIHYQTPLVVMIILTVIALTALSLYVMCRQRRVDDAFTAGEISAWGIIFAVALFLLFPVSAPLYALLGPLAQILFPWRMQNLFMPALAFFLAVYMQWMVSERRMKTWKADFALISALMALTAFFIAAPRDRERDLPSDRILQAEIMAYPEYRTVWTDEGHFGGAYFLDRYARAPAAGRITVISGKGNAAVERWAWDGIVLKTHSEHGLTVRLNQFYFPGWSAEGAILRPENGSGRMLADIPAGNHRVVLRYSVYAGRPWLALASAISVPAALAWAGFFYRRRSMISLL